MPDASPCPRCGAPIPADAGGVCPACALAAAAGSAPHARFRTPPIAELAPLFPELELIEPIGAGAMGAVFRARQRKLERVVALKVLPAEGQIGERFPREAAALARLNHPNLVAVYDVGRTDGWCWLVMELIDGANLRQVMATGRMAQRDALALLLPLCDALAYAHAQGVVHRDIKPENILLDARGRPKLADFGLAKLAGSPVVATGTGQALGTPHYMAPEQVEGGRDVDGRADLYALGVVLYELLTGGLPLGRFAPPSQTPGVDPRIDAIVLRLLEKDPAKRYPDAHVLGCDLAAIDGDAAVASPPQHGERGRRDGVLLMLYAIALASVLLSGGRFEQILSGLLSGRATVVLLPVVLVALALVLAIAWGGRLAARGRRSPWVSVARVAAACAVPVFLVWQPLAGIAALVVVWHLFDDGLWPLAELRASLRRGGRVHDLRAWVGPTVPPRVPPAPPAVAAGPVFVHARAEAAPPASQHIVVQTKGERVHIGFFGFLATIVRGVFHLIGIALLITAGTVAWALLDPSFGERVRRAADDAGVELPRRWSHAVAPAAPPAPHVDAAGTVEHDAIGRIEAGWAEIAAADPTTDRFQRAPDGERWMALGRAKTELDLCLGGSQGMSVESLGLTARSAHEDARALLAGAKLDPRVASGLGRMDSGWAELAARPAIAFALPSARFEALARAIGDAPIGERAWAVRRAAGSGRFTAEQATRLLRLVPDDERTRTAQALRPRVLDPELFVAGGEELGSPHAGGSIIPPAEAAP